MAYGIVVGGSLCGGLGAFLTEKPPLFRWSSLRTS
ncbi:hypothetical protein D478_04396 [Brevibacillus agri BAB-2500]|nr:hypothetical protein D478_04396 [Brevibacillus agri BAB-2500]